MNIRRTTFLVAAILAVATGWLTLTYLSSLRPPSTQQRAVIVSTQEITARERITDAMVAKQTRSTDSIQPDALSDPSQAVGSLALVTIPAGSQLTASTVGNNVAFALPVRLQPGMRAVSIPVDRVKDVSGLVQPGDRVDVIAIPPPRSNGGPPPRAATIFRGIRVLAVGNALENPSATPSPEEQTAVTVTLEVTPSQADLLAWADANATLRLALRSPRESLRTEPAEELTLSGNTVASPPPLLAPPIMPALSMIPPIQPVKDARTISSPVELIVGDQIVDPNNPNAGK
jgi:pilus assembly protein CpaB